MTDQPSAALVLDLKRRGLLDSTIVLWTGEFGRLPVSQGTDGRDHNRHALLALAGRRRLQEGLRPRRDRRVRLQRGRERRARPRPARDAAARPGPGPQTARPTRTRADDSLTDFGVTQCG